MLEIKIIIYKINTDSDKYLNGRHVSLISHCTIFILCKNDLEW